VIAVSEELAKHCRRLGTRPNRIVVLPNAVDPEIFHPHRDGTAVRQRLGIEDAFVVGFSGTLKPWHGIDHLLRAAAKAQAEVPGIQLMVMGEGPLRQELESLAKELDSESKVHFTGFVPHADVGDYLAACDVLTAPYPPLDNHWFSPLKVAEYLAVGRPVVASAIGQLKEQLGEEQGVVLVPPGDEQALSEILVKIARDAQWRTRLARTTLSAPPRTWNDVVLRVLEEGETARRKLWGWQE
jgi:glycosyltransferase involved in cell wall biosynthesis